MSPNAAGLVGAVLGFILAAVEVFIVLPRIMASLQRSADVMPAGEKRRAELGIRIIWIAFVAQLAVYPIVAYFIGRALA